MKKYMKRMSSANGYSGIRIYPDNKLS